MSTKLVQQSKMQISSSADADKVLEDKLPIIINGIEKLATGLTKRTTVEDVIFAMLSVSDPSFRVENLVDYGIVEKWQGNERILDGKIKIYKLIRLWKSLPGNQLKNVKFIIKKRASGMKLAQRNQNVEKCESKNKFAFCTVSPAMSKTWNVEKAQRKCTFVKRQLEMAANENSFNTVFSSESEQSDVDSDLNSEDDIDSLEQNKLTNHKRYASIKRFNRSRKSSVRQIKKSFIELVNKQNEIIDKQINQISDARSKSKHLKNKKSLDINESDIKQTFCQGQNSIELNDQQAKEYSSLCKNYFKIQNCLDSKLQHIEDLKTKIDKIYKSSDVQVQVDKTNKKLQSKIELTNNQTEKLNDMSMALNKIDDVITLKEKFIQSLELELQQLDINEVGLSNKKSISNTSESARSSTSSVFTSISSISTSQYANANSVQQKPVGKFSYGDNESDTGISSANSEEFNSHLETLV